MCGTYGNTEQDHLCQKQCQHTEHELWNNTGVSVRSLLCSRALHSKYAQMFCFLQLLMGTSQKTKHHWSLCGHKNLHTLCCRRKYCRKQVIIKWIKDTSYLESHSEKKDQRNPHFVPLLQYTNEKRNLWIPSCCQIPSLSWAFWGRKEMGHRANPWLLHCYTTHLTVNTRG